MRDVLSTIVLASLLACGEADPCPSPFRECGGACVDPRVDTANCGTCGHACAPGRVCSAGTCDVTCGTPLEACGPADAPYCVDTASDPAHCGGCDAPCEPGEACLSGGCVPTCEGAGGTLCGDHCVSLTSDDANCGACGRECGEGRRCVGSQCISGDCPVRAGGAFVTFAVCSPPGSNAGSSFKGWITREAFIVEAEQLLATGAAMIPVFDLLPGSDCDGQWSFHVDPATAGFAAFAIEVCDACPPYVEANVGDFVSIGWCPWSARVVAVERRP